VNVTDNSLARVCAFLADHTTLSLATIGPDGEPQAADLYYAETGDLTLYFVSAANSRHAANVTHNPRVAATVHADSTGWRDIRGVQLEGTCTRVAGTERVKAWARYIAKFPFILTDPALARALQKVEMHRITPHWLRWIDNSVSLGHNQEWQMADGEWLPAPTAPRGSGIAGS
jgi:uncharacterized protein YhbP (UPF0306 family)